MSSLFILTPVGRFNFLATALMVVITIIASLLHPSRIYGVLIIENQIWLVVGLTSFFLVLAALYSTLRPDPILARACLITAIVPPFVCMLLIDAYLVAAFGAPMIDGALARFDAMLGIDYPAMVAWAVERDWVKTWARPIYLLPFSALPFIAIGMLFLTQQIDELERVIASTIISANVTMIGALFFPAASAFAYHQIPLVVSDQLGTVVDASYNLYYQRLRMGDFSVTVNDIRGVIAFPSFHTVIGVTMIYHLRSRLWLAIPLGVASAAMIAATPIIGGHYIADTIVGFFVGVFAVWMAARIGRGAPKT